MKKQALRNVFGKYLVELGGLHKDLLVISCDLKSATKTIDFLNMVMLHEEVGKMWWEI